MAEPDFVSVTRAAHELGYTYQKTRELALRRILTIHWVDSKMFITCDSLDEYLANRARRLPAQVAPLALYPRAAKMFAGGVA